MDSVDCTISEKDGGLLFATADVPARLDRELSIDDSFSFMSSKHLSIFSRFSDRQLKHVQVIPSFVLDDMNLPDFNVRSVHLRHMFFWHTLHFVKNELVVGMTVVSQRLHKLSMIG